MPKAKFPIQLLENPTIMGTLEIGISLPKNTQLLASALGIGAEEQANITGQKLQEVIQLLGHLLGADVEL